MAKSQVKGHKQVARSLRSMMRMQRPVGEASRYALKPVLDDAKANLAAPKAGRPSGNIITGELIASMKIRQLKKTKSETQTVVAATDKGIKKAHLVEFGTDPHWQPKRGVMHPGARPFPFLTPAFYKNEGTVKDRMSDRLVVAIENQAKRLNRRR